MRATHAPGADVPPPQVQSIENAVKVQKLKKKPSTLKKRIIQERYRVFQERQICEANSAENEPPVLSSSAHSTTVDPTATSRMLTAHPVYVFGLSEDVDLKDNDEMEELVSNVKELFAPFSSLLNIYIYSCFDSPSVNEQLLLGSFSSMIELQYGDVDSAQDAVSLMHGTVIGGETMLVFSVLPEESCTPELMTMGSSHIKEQTPLDPTSVLVLFGVFSAEDLLEGDVDSINETCSDILSLCTPFEGALSASPSLPLQWTTPNNGTSHTQPIMVEEFRTLLLAQWQSRHSTEAERSSSEVRKVSAALQRQRQHLQQFHKPLLQVSFQSTIPHSAWSTSFDAQWMTSISSPWYAFILAQLTHNLQIGGESLRVHCLSRSSDTKKMQLVDAFRNSESIESIENVSHSDFCPWQLQCEASDPVVWESELLRIPGVVVRSTNDSEDTDNPLRITLSTVSLRTMMEIWHFCVGNCHSLISMQMWYQSLPVVSPACIFAATHSPFGARHSLGVDQPDSLHIELYIENFITTEDMKDYMIGNDSHEDLSVAKQDLLEIWQDQLVECLHETKWYAEIVQCIRQISILPFHLRNEGDTRLTAMAMNGDAERNDRPHSISEHSHDAVYVLFAQQTEAVRAMCYFDGLVLGGIPISAQVFPLIEINPTTNAVASPEANVSVPIDPPAEEGSTNHQNNIAAPTQHQVTYLQRWVAEHLPSLLPLYHESLATTTTTTTTTKPDSTLAAAAASSSSATVDPTVRAETTPPRTKNDKASAKEDTDGMNLALFAFNGDQVSTAQLLKPRKISLYRIARHIPKLAFHSSMAASAADAPTTAAVHHHIPLATDEINTYAKELLRKLSTHQRELRDKLLSEKPPFHVYPPTSSQMTSAIRRKQQQAALQTFREGQLRKFKLKMRYVCGLKQTIQAVKAGRMKLILLAPNTEASVALDQKIVQLLVLADALSIPVCHCLSRRLLGKALQMPIKQSCVGILSAEGKQDSYELYRKMMNFLRPIDVGKNLV